MSINSRCWKEILSQSINAFILFSLVWFLAVSHSKCNSDIIFGYIPTPVSREKERSPLYQPEWLLVECHPVAVLPLLKGGRQGFHGSDSEKPHWKKRKAE